MNYEDWKLINVAIKMGNIDPQMSKILNLLHIYNKNDEEWLTAAMSFMAYHSMEDET